MVGPSVFDGWRSDFPLCIVRSAGGRTPGGKSPTGLSIRSSPVGHRLVTFSRSQSGRIFWIFWRTPPAASPPGHGPCAARHLVKKIVDARQGTL